MIRTLLTALVAVVALAVFRSAVAESPAPESDDARYSYHRVNEGFLRLDLRGGEVSMCNHHVFGWSCEVLPDDRATFEKEIARLRSENATLKKVLLDRGLPLPSGINADVTAASGSEVEPRSPGGTDVEQVKALVGRVWRQLVDMIMSFQKDVMKKT